MKVSILVLMVDRSTEIPGKLRGRSAPLIDSLVTPIETALSPKAIQSKFETALFEFELDEGSSTAIVWKVMEWSMVPVVTSTERLIVANSDPMDRNVRRLDRSGR